MRERRQVRVADASEQLLERQCRIDIGTKYQRVDEHSDEVVECRLTATGHRRADGDVGGAAQSSQQQRVRRLHHHEQRRVVRAGEIGQSTVQPGRNLDAQLAACVGRHGGAGPTRRQRQLIG